MEQELPNGWEWQMGESGENYYTYNFGTSYHRGGDLVGLHGLGGYHGQMYWDKGQKHTVVIRPVVEMMNDDPVYGYNVVSRAYDSEEEALEAVPELIQEMKDNE